MRKFLLFCCFCLVYGDLSAQNVRGEYISTEEAAHWYEAKLKQQPFVVFPELRERPIQWTDSLKVSWLKEDYRVKPYLLHTQPGEYFVFQEGIWAIRQELENVQVRFSGFKNEEGEVIPAKQLTCFNTGGINFQGKSFTEQINIPRGAVHALWMGINIPATAKGKYSGTVTLIANKVSQTVKIQIAISGKILTDHGFDEGRRLSRLSWLNSTAGINTNITKGYIPVSRNGRLISILGRSVEIADNGLPERITTSFTPSNQSIIKQGIPITAGPFHFIIEKEDGGFIRLRPGKIQFTSGSPSSVSWKVINTSADCDLICNGSLEYDGFANYHLTVKAKKRLQIKDIRLAVAMNKDKATYMMGLNKAGGLRPATWEWKWDTAKNQDALWLGAVNGGLRIKWKGENYVQPLVNVYYTYGRLHLPPSWGNGGKGGVNMYEKEKKVMVSAYSGTRTMKKGEEQHYDFELLITPFKTMNKAVQFGDRYYHSGENETGNFIPEADSLGANIITVHQGNDLYPFINYPYSDVNISALKNFISAGHQDNKRVKVYYTTRELTVNLPELWPFLSLNGEVIYPGPGATAKTVTNPKGPDPWLKEHLRDRKYIPAWVAHFTKGKYAGMQDLSVITTPDSRLNNFYVAGLDWMVHHLKIDGIYIDDCSLDRTTIRRVRKILDDNRVAANIDMHSWNHFNPYAGWASCLNLYMELLPYIDQLWIGEGRNYDTPPDYWLVEISGIPFGLPGQMLQNGGNPWRGMVYGITNRAGWTGTPPDHIWKFWDQYDIKDKEMIGYWDPRNPVTPDNDSIKVTVYKGPEESILAVGNFSSTEQSCSLHIDYNKLGYDKDKCSFNIPFIERYQAERQLNSLEQLRIPGKQGYIVVIKQHL